LDLLSEVSYFLTFSKYIDHILHCCLATQPKGNIDKLTLVFLNVIQFMNDLEFVANNFFQMNSKLCAK
jgi:hypothetical protein